MVPEDPRGRGAGQAGAARPGAVDGRAVDQLGSGPGPPPSQLRIPAGRARPRSSCRPSDPLQRPRERRRSIRPNTATVKHHLARDCQASPGTGHECRAGPREQFLYEVEAGFAGPAPALRLRRPRAQPSREEDREEHTPDIVGARVKVPAPQAACSQPGSGVYRRLPPSYVSSNQVTVQDGYSAWLGPEELLARCDNEDVGLRRGTGPSGHGHAGHLATAADFGRTGPRSAGNHRASLSSAPARQLMYEPVVDPTCRSLRIRRFISPASETKPSLRGTCVGCNVAVDRSWKRHRRPETIDRPELWRSVKPSA